MELSSYSTSRSHIDKCLANSEALHIPTAGTSNQSLSVSNRSGGPQIMLIYQTEKPFQGFFMGKKFDNHQFFSSI